MASRKGTMDDVHAPTSQRENWGESLRSRGPLVLVTVGGAGALLSLLLGGVCARYVTAGISVECLPLLDPTLGAVLLALSLVPIAAGLYLIFFNRRETFRHTCAECGKVYRDGNRDSVYRVRGKMACSSECAAKMEARLQEQRMRDMVRVLEAMAVEAPQDVERRRARERLGELAATEPEPIGGLARDALARLESGAAARRTSP